MVVDGAGALGVEGGEARAVGGYSLHCTARHLRGEGQKGVGRMCGVQVGGGGSRAGVWRWKGAGWAWVGKGGGAVRECMGVGRGGLALWVG